MARDSSPFAQRLKALAARAGLQSAAGKARADGPTPADSAARATSYLQDHAPPQGTDVDPDEQPTGEFPAVTDSSTDPPTASDADVGPESKPAPPRTDSIDWTPDPQPFEQQPLTESVDLAELGDQSDSTSVPAQPATTWPVVPPAPLQQAESAATPVAESGRPVTPPSIRPIWLDPPAEAEPASPSEGISNVPTDAASQTSSGPTLAPPLVAKMPIGDDAPSGPAAADDPTQAQADDAPVDRALQSPRPTGSTTDWTPAALHEALSIPDDDRPFDDRTPKAAVDVTDAAPADAASTGPTDAEAAAVAGADPAPAGDHEPVINDALMAPLKRRKLARPGFLKRPGVEARGADATATDGPSGAESTPASPEPEAHEAETTSRFKLITRHRRDATGPAAADPATPVPGQAPLAEAVPAPNPVMLTAEPVPYKPTFAERAGLRRRAKSLRGRRDAGLLELGAIVLDQSRFGDPTGGSLVRRRTSDLADLDGEIASIEIALDDERDAQTVKQLGVVRCNSCGSLLGSADRFCSQCGAAHPGASAEGGSEQPAP